MPERRNVRSMLVGRIFGGSWIWNGLTGQISDHETSGMTREIYSDISLLVDDLFLAAANRIDWTRVLLQARGRCMSLEGQEGHEESKDNLYDKTPCGDCLREALTTPETFGDLTDPSESEEERADRHERLEAWNSFAKEHKLWKHLPDAYRGTGGPEQKTKQGKRMAYMSGETDVDPDHDPETACPSCESSAPFIVMDGCTDEYHGARRRTPEPAPAKRKGAKRPYRVNVGYSRGLMLDYLTAYSTVDKAIERAEAWLNESDGVGWRESATVTSLAEDGFHVQTHATFKRDGNGNVQRVK